MTKIVIAGAGAGGIELAVFLGKKYGSKKDFEITLINERATHIWKPHLHEVAAGTLDTHFDTVNIPLLAKHKRFTFVQGTFNGLDREKKEITLAPIHNEKNELLVDTRTLNYDILVIAIGVVNNDFNTPGVSEYAMKLEDVASALKLKQRIADDFLKLVLNKDSSGLDIAIVGGGATGVELAAELKCSVDDLHGWGIKELDKSALRIQVIDGAPGVLHASGEKISQAATKELEKLNVTIKPNTLITEITQDGIVTKTGEFIKSDLTIWAAGIKGAAFLKDLAGLETNRINQLVVKKTLQTTNDDHVFAIGDCCACPMGDDGKLVPARAQAAHQMAVLCAENIDKLLKNQKLDEYKYHDHGMMISFSKFSAIGKAMVIGNVHGKFARKLYLYIYKMHQQALFGYCSAFFISIAKKFSKYKHSGVKMPW